MVLSYIITSYGQHSRFEFELLDYFGAMICFGVVKMTFLKDAF